MKNGDQRAGNKLNGYFEWNKSLMKCFAGMLIALIKVRTVNLTEPACAFGSKAKLESRYKRIKRFLAYLPLNSQVLHYDNSCVN